MGTGLGAKFSSEAESSELKVVACQSLKLNSVNGLELFLRCISPRLLSRFDIADGYLGSSLSK
jgi:hypothetical protein